jgi:hypothetical protein
MLTLAFTDALDIAFAHAKQILDPSVHERLEKGFKLVATEQVRAIPCQDGNWFVQGSEVEPYLVVREPVWQCECPDHHYRTIMCAHIIAVQLWVRATQMAHTAQPESLAEPTPEHAPAPALLEETAPVPTPLPEAPCSVNCHVLIAGRQVQVTLRGTDEAEVLTRLEAVLARYPLPQAAAAPQGQEPREGWCTIHTCTMHFNEGKDGRQGWWSHRTQEGRWCQGKPKR